MTPSYRLVHESEDAEHDRLRLVACDDGTATIGVLEHADHCEHTADVEVSAAVHFPTPGDLAGLQDAIADYVCPDSIRERPGVLAASVAGISEDLDKISAYAGTPDVPTAEFLRHAPAIAEAERQLGKVAEALKAAFYTARGERLRAEPAPLAGGHRPYCCDCGEDDGHAPGCPARAAALAEDGPR